MKNSKFKPWMAPAAASVPVLVLAVTLIIAALSSDGSDYFIHSLHYGAVFEPSGFSLFGISLYNLMQIVGAALGYYAIIKNHELFNVSIKNAFIIITVFYIQAFIGFKLLYAIQICIRTGDFIHWDFNGASVYGAFFGMMLVAPPLAAIMKLPRRDIADIFSIGGIVYLAFGRLGCFFAGCCGSRLFYIGDHPIYFPVQLTEVFCDLVIAAILYAKCFDARENGKFSVGAMPPGLIMYGTARFFLEFLRTNPITRIGITEAQIHSLLIILIGAGMAIAAIRKEGSIREHFMARRERAERSVKPNSFGRLWLIPVFAAVPVMIFAVFLVVSALGSDGSSYAHALLTYGGAVHPVAGKVLGLKLYTFITAFGAAAGLCVAVLFARRMGIRTTKAFAFAVTALLIGFAGGKLLYAIETAYDRGHFELMLDGQSLFGVLYFAALSTPLLANMYDLRRRTAYDVAAVLWLTCFIIARVGCVFSGCCGGKTFMVGSSPLIPPVQLMEIFCNLLILAFCLRYAGIKRKNGDKYLGLFPIFLMSYSVIRFLLEFLRTNPVTKFGTTEAQKHALLVFAVGLIMALRAKPYEPAAKKEKKIKR